MLAKLNTLNSNLNGNQVKKGQLKVPYTMFYIPQLADKIDIRSDYMKWAHSDLNGPKVRIKCYLISISMCFIKIPIYSMKIFRLFKIVKKFKYF